MIQFLKIFVLGTCTYLKWPRTQSTYFWALQCRFEGNLKLGTIELYMIIDHQGQLKQADTICRAFSLEKLHLLELAGDLR